MKIVRQAIAAAAFLGLSSTASAMLITYDFDSIAANTYTEADFSAMFAEVSFDNTGGDSFSVSDCSLLGDFTCGNAILNSPFSTTGNSTIATFDSAVNSVSVTLGDYNADADNIYLNAYDAANNLLATDVFSIAASSSNGYTLNVAATDIAYVEYYGIGVNDNSVFWDNFSFDTASVPAPATLALFGLGLLGIATAKRKKA